MEAMFKVKVKTMDNINFSFDVLPGVFSILH